MTTPFILILYYSRNGSVRTMAEHIARGVEQQGLAARLRTVPSISANCEATAPSVPQTGALYCKTEDLKHCSGLALGSPTRFGNMAAPMKYFWDQTSDLWLNGDLIDKPGTVFTASSSLHGGQETTLLSMMLPLFHHGMLLMGLPYSTSSLMTSQTGGTPYGASHWAHQHNDPQLSDDEIEHCQTIGQRIALKAKQLQ